MNQYFPKPYKSLAIKGSLGKIGWGSDGERKTIDSILCESKLNQVGEFLFYSSQI